jgi:hypothetical protein
MSKQQPVIVYVGETPRALALQTALQAQGWTLLHPQEMMEALAMHIFYYPDAFIIEDTAEFDDPRGTFAHLRSVGAENILVLTNAPASWGSGVRALPTYISIDSLVGALAGMMEAAETAERIPEALPLLN